MPIETNFRYIDDLNALWPEEADQVSTTDEHVQGVKSVLKNQFPNLGDAVVTATASGLNDAGQRYVGDGGMAVNDGNTSFNINGNTDTEMPAPNAVVYQSDKVNSNPATGVIQVIGLSVLNSVRLHLQLTLLRTDSDSITTQSLIKVWIKRVSDQAAIGSTFGMTTIPSLNDAVQFTLEGVDPQPGGVSESYVVMWSQEDNSNLTFRQTMYNFWMEPIGEE